MEYELNLNFINQPDSYQVTTTQGYLFEKFKNILGKKDKLI